MLCDERNPTYESKLRQDDEREAQEHWKHHPRNKNNERTGKSF